jgi:hypothetical protein
MITATDKHATYKVNGLTNRGQWFGKTWLILIGMGLESFAIVAEADNESDAIDALTDSKYGHLIKTDEKCECCKVNNFDFCTCNFAGNFSERVDLDNVYITKCKVNYFAPKTTYLD